MIQQWWHLSGVTGLQCLETRDSMQDSTPPAAWPGMLLNAALVRHEQD